MKINSCLDCAHCDVCGLKDRTNEFFSDFYDWLRVAKRQSYDIPEFPPNCSIEPKCTKFQSLQQGDKCMNLNNNITVGFKYIESPVISNANVFGLANAVRGSKFPMAVNVDNLTSDITNTTKNLGSVATGTGHDQYLTAIIAQFDLTFTVKAWTEAERYHFFDFISSQSTIHRIAKFDLEEQYSEYVDEEIIVVIKKLQKNYNETGNKEDYLKLLYSNPCGFKLTAAMTTNYRQLKTIYHQRKNHRLPEWQTFCEQLEQFPYFKELCLGKGDN